MGPHTYATGSGSSPQYLSGKLNHLVAPVRRHMTQYFAAVKEPGERERGEKALLPVNASCGCPALPPCLVVHTRLMGREQRRPVAALWARHAVQGRV
jgi:hypothetical protein